MDAPEVSYARSGDVSLAYVVTGTDAIDLVFVHGFVGNLETAWEQPLRVAFFERLGSFARVIEFDRRGTGLSDRVREVPTLETRMDDLRAVMDRGRGHRVLHRTGHRGGSSALRHERLGRGRAGDGPLDRAFHRHRRLDENGR